MAVTEYGVNHPLAVKLWSKKLMVESLKETYFSRFLGKGSDSLIQIKDETSKSAGDRITFGLRMQLSGAGIQGDATLEGNEEALTTYSDNLLINQLRHAVRSAGKMSEQRVPFDVREEAMSGLKDWWSDRLDTAFFNQITGNTAVSDTRYTGNNSTIAPTTATPRIVVANQQQAEGSLSATASCNFSLRLIDRAVALAKTTSPLIRPIKVDGADKYVAFIHPYQTYQLRTDTSTGSWQDFQKQGLAGGEGRKNPIYTGAIGEYNGVVIHESTRLPAALAGATGGRRAVLCGAQSAVFGFGRDQGSGTKANWYEEMFDYGNELGVSGGMIFGLKKTQFNSVDFGTIVMTSYSPDPQ